MIGTYQAPRAVPSIPTATLAVVAGAGLAALWLALRFRGGEAGRASEERYRVLAETSADSIITMDRNSIIVYANPATERIFGYSVDELVGESLMHLIPERFRAAHRAGVTRYLETGNRNISWHRLELRGLHRSAREVPLEVSFAEFERDGDRFFIGTMRDITERKQAETERERLIRELEAQAVELEESQAEMEMSNEELQHANSELLAKTEEAERARAAADEANTAKSAFLATMSHELRTPLNAIGGYTELLELGLRGPVTEAQRQDLLRIRRNQQHLLGLINQVLNFAKIEAGQIHYAISDVRVDRALSAVLALVAPQLRAKNLTYEHRRGNPNAAVRVDRDRFEQIILNLLTNAIKFTAPGGRIILAWDVRDDQVVIRVRDTGRGIAPDKLEMIFDPFVQADPALTREAEGVGLGLAISRDLAQAMKGDLTAESEPGKGSIFTLTLPKSGEGE